MQLNSIEELIEDIRQGKMVILMDDEDRENEGDLVMAAEHVTAEAINFMAKYIAHKGSITVDGISLTVNSVAGAVFSLNIIPHTQEVTTIGQWQVGTPVNLEVDIIARYLERLLLGEKAAEPTSEGISMAFLAENGFLK